MAKSYDIALFLFSVATFAPCLTEAQDTVSQSTQVDIITIWPHNTSSFTEGFFILDNTFYESTGLSGHSFIRQYDYTLHEGRSEISTRKEFEFPNELFGEGIACIGDILYALTYKSQELLQISKVDFSLIDTIPLKTSTGEGWGLTTDGSYLIASDGSSSIFFFDPWNDYALVKTLDVTKDGKGITAINELEFVDGEILANVWHKNVLLRIDMNSGHVIETIDLDWMENMVANLQHMTSNRWRREAVMNGIAYNPNNRHVYLTGKLWDSVFEVTFSYLTKADVQVSSPSDEGDSDDVNDWLSYPNKPNTGDWNEIPWME